MKICLQVLLLIFVSLSLPTYTAAQKCKTNIIRQQHIQQSPNILQQIERLNQQSENWIRNNTNNGARSKQVVTLDVVVHVLWKEPEENISEEQILSQIAVLNKDFRKQNDDLKDQTPLPFQNIAADIEIEFRLATTDPFGNPTNGITRTQTTVEEIGATDNWYSESTGGIAAWDNKRYINIWVCNIGTAFLGFATPPGTADQDDGLVIGHQYFGTTGTAADNMPNHLGRTATHEMGHYFNLEHLWGIDGGCDDDDFVTDTPNQNESSFDCPSYPKYDFCTTTGNGINFNNFMDYSDDECLTMFTQGQKMRMLAALNGPRASLLNTGPCLPAGATCDDRNPNTINDAEDGNCNCIGELCPPAGTVCNDGQASTKEDQYDDNCNCIGTPCPAFGTACDDGLSITENDIEDGNCNCRGTLCPAPETACDDGDPNTINDVEDGNCNCKGTLTISCPPSGTACNDNNPETENDIEDGNCNCAGTLIITCPPLGTSCNDNNPSTKNDVEDGNCNCAGTPCPVANTSCNDNNPATQNDVEDGNCNCAGTPCPAANTSCNDNNPTTQNDVEDGNCNCAGTPCPVANTPCNDNNPATQNDVEDGNCNCAGTIMTGMDNETETETETETDNIFTSYPILTNLFENCDEESVAVYKSGIYTYFFITSPSGSKLYNEQGQLYCTNAANYNCLDVYGLTDLVTTQSCKIDETTTTPNSNTLEIFHTYSWLNDIINPINCTANLLIYESGGYEYILIEEEGNTVLYNADGVIYCTNSVNYNCTDFYRIDKEIASWSCTDNATDLAFVSMYPWLTGIIDPLSCSETKVTVYQQGAFKFLLVETTAGTQLYREDGNLYCTNQPNYSCTDLYNLEIIEDTWVCQNGNIQNVPSNTLIPTSARKVQPSYTVYPNPNNGQFYMDFSAVADTPELIKVIDVHGAIIQTLTIDTAGTYSRLSINILTPESGVYFIQIYSKTGVYTERIIIQ